MISVLIFALTNGLVAEVFAQPFLISGYGEGIYYSALSEDGAMSDPVLLVKQFNASFFCFHSKQKDLVYSVTETMRNDPNNPAAIVAYRLDRQSALNRNIPTLQRINDQRIDGDIPCHVTMDPAGKFLIVANYTNGSVVVFPVNQEDGSVMPECCNLVHQLTDGKKSSNAHCSALSPTGRWVLVADLGLDRVMIYQLDSQTGRLTPAEQPFLKMADGAGPRHLSFHPSGKYVYIINETNLTMTSAAWDEAAGQLTTLNTVSTVPEGTQTKGFSTAEVLVHPRGRFVFGSNRGHDTIVTMMIDSNSGRIDRVANESSGGKTPRNFRISPDGRFLLAENQTSNTIFSFAIDENVGKLIPSGKYTSVKSPACIRFLNE